MRAKLTRLLTGHRFFEWPLCADIVEKVENRTTPKIPQKLIFGVPAAAKHRGADTKVLDRFCVK